MTTAACGLNRLPPGSRAARPPPPTGVVLLCGTVRALWPRRDWGTLVLRWNTARAHRGVVISRQRRRVPQRKQLLELSAVVVVHLQGETALAPHRTERRRVSVGARWRVAFCPTHYSYNGCSQPPCCDFHCCAARCCAETKASHRRPKRPCCALQIVFGCDGLAPLATHSACAAADLCARACLRVRGHMRS